VTEKLLVVMAKAPVAGNVKTRLSPDLSADDAARLSACFLKDRLVEMGKLNGCDRAIAFTPEKAEHLFEQYSANRFSLFPQRGLGLGERMSNIFKEKHPEGYHAIVVVGTDSPDLPGSIVTEAFDRLMSEPVDIILGPAVDGGYYLVGMKRHHPEVFERIPWGTETVLAATLEAARESGIRTACLQTWHDIDTIADIRRFYDQYAHLSVTEQRPGAITMACLADMKGMLTVS
jgi:rSAM/selenodomain-associated transferase 1